MLLRVLQIVSQTGKCREASGTVLSSRQAYTESHAKQVVTASVLIAYQRHDSVARNAALFTYRVDLLMRLGLEVDAVFVHLQQLAQVVPAAATHNSIAGGHTLVPPASVLTRPSVRLCRCSGIVSEWPGF